VHLRHRNKLYDEVSIEWPGCLTGNTDFRGQGESLHHPVRTQ
jgi:hypothetical protein